MQHLEEKLLGQEQKGLEYSVESQKNSMKIISLHVALLVLLIICFPIATYGQQGTGSIEVDVKYTNGDRADYSGMVLKVYQDFSKTPYKVIESLSSNPYNIPLLPLGHKYKVEVFVNSMYSSVNYVNLQSNQERLDITMPLSGGMRFNVFFNDGLTPIQGAKVSIKSHDDKQWTEGITDDQGRTIRFWMQSTTKDDNYYVADISIGGDLLYKYSPVKLTPGEREEYKVITPWPSIVDELITVHVYKTSSAKVSLSDGNFVVELYDNNGKKVTESKVNARGESFFSKIKVGTYTFDAIKLNDTKREEWGSKKITIAGSQKYIEILKTDYEIKSDETAGILSCKCVAFRLDNIQDYWLNNVQPEIINTFQKKNADLTIAIISKAFGEDPKVTSFVKGKIKNTKPTIEIANNGWEFEDFTTYNKEEQFSIIKKSNERIFAILGIVPSIFVPPYGKINDDIFDTMTENKIKYLSAHVSADPPPYNISNSTFYRFPATVFTGYASMDGTMQRITHDKILANIQSSLHDYRFAVVELHFQDYAVSAEKGLENKIDIQQIHELELLIDEIRNSGLAIVTISKISQDESMTKHVIPVWIKSNAQWWAEDKISESDFISGIEYMIKKGIIIVQNLPESGESKDQKVPLWVKNNAKWWSEGQISDDDFVLGLQYLVKVGIVRI